MEEDLEPIFDFKPLRDFLVDKGYIVEKANGYREIRPEVIDPMEAIKNGELDVRDDGIYIIDPITKEEQQVYLYKYDYYLHKYGEQVPRYHICRCATILDFMNRGVFDGHYVRANTEIVPVKDKVSLHIEKVSNLPLCRNCIAKIRQYAGISSNEFVEILRQARGEEEVEEEVHEVDIFGYTRDWDNISKEYRESHHYTCEECGLQIDDLFDRQYIHVHHIDANKLNNKESNLKCLCLRCHSNVDEIHQKNLTTGANRIIWEAFNAAYPYRNIRKSKISPTISTDDLPF